MMSTEETKDIEKQAAKLKFIASQKASELHDLIEDRLWTDFEDIPAVSEATYNACQAWKEKLEELNNQ